jgi:peptide/nickel transport system permease protein
VTIIPPEELIPNDERFAFLSLARGRLRGQKMFVAGALVLLVILVMAVLAPWITPYPQDAQGGVDPVNSLLAPSSQHWFGTDQVGRDVYTRVVFGARTSLLIVFSVLSLSVLIGVTLGVIAGYAGGWIRDLVMRVTDVFLAFPALLLSLALCIVLEPDLKTAILAITVTWWPWYTRLAAGVAASISGRAYMDAVRALGVSPTRAVLRHVLPNSLTPVIVQLSLDAGGIILTAAALSFLGLGAQEPTAEWGLMVSQGQDLFTTAYWVSLYPGLAILIAAFAFNMLGEGMRTALDPRRGFTS